MIKSSGSKRGWRGGRRIVLAVSAVMVGAVVFGSAGTASAKDVKCESAITPVNLKKPGADARWTFKCDEELRGFSIITNKTFDFFGTEVEVSKPDGTPAGQSATIQCTGNVPGPGFGCGTPSRNTPTDCEKVTGSAPGPQDFGAPCTNRVDPSNEVAVSIGFPQSPCKPSGQYKAGADKLRVWMMALTEPLIGSFNASWTNQDQTTYTRGTYISEPFKVKIVKYNECRKSAIAGSKGKSKRKSKKSAVSATADSIALRLW